MAGTLERTIQTMNATPEPLQAAPRRFLVVDDDIAFRARLVKAIQTRRFEAVGAGSAQEAIVLARRHSVDAAIVDLRLPGATGLDIVRDLVGLNPAMQVVVLTGYGSIATAVEAVRRGEINYLTKPLDADQILAAFVRETEGAPDVDAAPRPAMPSLARVEWEHIQRILHDCDGNISHAARRLGLHRRSLQRKLSKLPPLE